MDEKYQRLKVLGKGSFGKAYLVKNTEENELCSTFSSYLSSTGFLTAASFGRSEALKDRPIKKDGREEWLHNWSRSSASAPFATNFHVVEAPPELQWTSGGPTKGSTLTAQQYSEVYPQLRVCERPGHLLGARTVFITRKHRLCIVMDYADDGDVHMKIKSREGKLLEEDRPARCDRRQLWFVQTCFALKHVHDRKVLHRDLKTQNIFLMSNGPRARRAAQDRPYNFTSDVWSLGVVLYEMSTLKHPFDADSLDAHMRPMINKILCYGFLQETMEKANTAYHLGLDLSDFAKAAAESVMREKQAASPSGSATPGAGDVGVASLSLPGRPTTASPEKEEERSCSSGLEYEEEFEDYSGSEAGDEKHPPSELRESVANLKIGAGTELDDTELHRFVFAAQSVGCSLDGRGTWRHGSGKESDAHGLNKEKAASYAAKADSLRAYLRGLMPEDSDERERLPEAS
eukprot:g1814.t1